MHSTGSVILGVVLWVALIGLWQLPVIIAFKRRVPNVAQIAVLDFFLGWTMIGWVISLIWALRPATVQSFGHEQHG